MILTYNCVLKEQIHQNKFNSKSIPSSGLVQEGIDFPTIFIARRRDQYTPTHCDIKVVKLNLLILASTGFSQCFK